MNLFGAKISNISIACRSISYKRRSERVFTTVSVAYPREMPLGQKKFKKSHKFSLFYYENQYKML